MVHSEKWFGKWADRINQPIQNTKRYYYRRGIIKIATGVLLIFGIIDLVRTRHYLNRYFDFIDYVINNGRFVTNDGTPGCGKTFTGGNMAYLLAQRRWEELQTEYFLQRSMLSEWLKCGDTEKLEAFRALEDSYKFFKEREDKYIPCLLSSIGLEEYGTGRKSYKLKPEIFLQVSRCPEYAVLFNDESGQLFGARTSKTVSVDVEDTCRFIRHFFDGMGINTNQDGSQNGIYLRRITEYVNHLFGQEWLLEPIRLEKRIARMEARYFKRLFKGKLNAEKAEYVGQKLYFLKQYSRTIGFRRIIHQLCNSNGAAIGEAEDYILPAIGCVKYDDRCFRKLYKAKDKDIDLEGWDSLVADEFDRSDYDTIICSKAAASASS